MPKIKLRSGELQIKVVCGTGRIVQRLCRCGQKFWTNYTAPLAVCVDCNPRNAERSATQVPPCHDSLSSDYQYHGSRVA